MIEERQSAHNRVVKGYFQTTSSQERAGPGHSVAASIKGLERRLGAWMNVTRRDVVDLGSGTGLLCRLAQAKGAATVVGVNLCQDEIEIARQIVDTPFVCMDIQHWLRTQPDESIDVIFALNILEHLSKDVLVDVLESAFRCLRPGGKLVAMVPNATSPFGGMTRYWDFTHHEAFTPSSVRQVARLIGFSHEVEFRECGPVPHGFRSLLRYALWRLIRMTLKAYLLVELADAKGGIYTADMMFRLRKPHSNE